MTVKSNGDFIQAFVLFVGMVCTAIGVHELNDTSMQYLLFIIFIALLVAFVIRVVPLDADTDGY